MRKVGKDILAAWLSALLLSGCAARGPIPPKLATSTADASADAKTDTGPHHGKSAKASPDATLEYQQAVDGCTAQATKETAGSILTIVTRLRPGAFTASYIACMRTKGYDVRQ